MSETRAALSIGPIFNLRCPAATPPGAVPGPPAKAAPPRPVRPPHPGVGQGTDLAVTQADAPTGRAWPFLFRSKCLTPNFVIANQRRALVWQSALSPALRSLRRSRGPHCDTRAGGLPSLCILPAGL